MNVTKWTPILAVVCGLLVMSSTAANAQTAPTITVTVNGTQVIMNWTDVAGAIAWRLEAGLTPGGTEIAVVVLPNVPSARPVVLNPVPAGTYYVRVRAIVVGVPVSPVSNEAIVEVTNGAGCSTIGAPTLSSTVSGRIATFNWDAVGGAIGYRLRFGLSAGRTDLEYQLSASTTSFTQGVPIDGTFYARVQAANACGQTATSDEHAFTVGGSACDAQNPALSASVQGGTVTFSWTGVSNPTGLALEFSRFDGQTELAEPVPASANSYQRYVPLTGTFYARLAVSTPCGVAYSAYTPFTVSTLNSGGPRTPNPAPGQLLPVPPYGPSVVAEVGRRYPGDLAVACHNNVTWLYRVVQELRRHDTRWGLNWKRGHEGAMSTDIVAYNPTDGSDEGNGQVYIFDVIGAMCEANYPTWNDVTEHTWTFRGSPECAAGTYCTKWTLQPYVAAGFPPDQQEQR